MHISPKEDYYEEEQTAVLFLLRADREEIGLNGSNEDLGHREKNLLIMGIG